MSDYQIEIDAFIRKGGRIKTYPCFVSADVLNMQKKREEFGVRPAEKNGWRLVGKKDTNFIRTVRQDLTSVYQTPDYEINPNELEQEAF